MIMRSKHVIFLIAALLAAHATSAFDNEPDGFRGIAWQSAFEDFADEMKFESESGDGEYKVYLRDNDKMFIGEIPLERVDYKYWNGRFSGVHLTPSRSDCNSLFEAFVDRFGQPHTHVKTGQYSAGFWGGLKTHITFLACRAIISSVVIIKEQQQLREAAEAAAEAEAKALREADKRPDF